MSTPTATTIANLALGRLGNTTISDLTEDSEPARACQVFYDQTRRAVLRSHRWNFAQDRAALVERATAPAFGWTKAFALPSDFIRVADVGESEHGDTISERFIIEGSSLLTDATSVNLIYVYDCSNVSLFDPLFVEVLSLKLAISVCDSLRGSSQQADRLASELAMLAGPLARRVDANEGRRRKGMLTRSSEFVRARYDSDAYSTNPYPLP